MLNLKWTGRLARVVLLSSLAFAAFGGVASVEAGQRKAVITEGADYFGRDLGTVKDVSLEDCQKACVDDKECVGFTYNSKARWCFKKSEIGDLRKFAGATSGKIVETDEPDVNVEDTRLSEIEFVPQDYIDAARQLFGDVTSQAVKEKLDKLNAAADKAIDAGNNLDAANALRKALALDPENGSLWSKFSDQAILVQSNDYNVRDKMVTESTGAAINAYTRATTVDAQVEALNSLANSFVTRELWDFAIKTTRYRLSLQDDDAWRKAYEKWVAEHGFRVTDNSVDTESATPRICVQFSQSINSSDPNITSYMSVEGGDQLDIEASADQLCAVGVQFGNRYHVTVRQGLPALDTEESLLKTVELDIYVRDRDASMHFMGKGYVLPKGPDATIPIASVNVDTLDAQVLKVGDRNLVNLIGEERFLSQLGSWDVDEITSKQGKEIWKGTVSVKRDTNKEVVTAIPVGELVKKLEPGVYALTARDAASKDEYDVGATQWFVVSDYGLSTMSGNDGLHAVIRSLSTAKAISGVELTLLATNNDILGKATTDDNGYAHFDAGLIKGTGGEAPAVLLAMGKDEDFAFIDLNKAAFDLSDRGVEGRAPPKPVDVFVTSERGVYRPGETVNLTALARDAAAAATDQVPLTLVVSRPDGNEFLRRVVDDQGAGGRSLSFDLPGEAQRGTWRVAAYTDPKGESIAETSWRVEDFQPERIDFTVKTDAKVLHSGESVDATLKADWLYGSPAANLAIEGEVYVTPAESIPTAPGYRFGLADDEFTPIAENVQSDGTAEDGTATVTLVTPDVSETTRPLQAAVHIRVLDTNGRPVERRMTMPVSDGRTRIGIKPQFADNMVDENGNARFDVMALDGDNNPTAAEKLNWTLSRVTTSYQWYRQDGSWDYHAVKSTEKVAEGTVDVTADAPAKIEAPVKWGEYELDVADADDELVPVSTTFEAGWYVPVTAEDTPDLLKVSLDKPRYKIGDTLTAHLESKFGGVAVVSVVDDRLITMKTVEVAEGGASVELPVTSEWGPGAYVSAMLLRPLDMQAKRMPSRAIGLTWATVDPGDRLLGVNIDAPMEMRPQNDLKVDVKVDGVRAGEDAYVTVAAVDVGILNLTQFAPPAPEDWYFAQRQLGMEFRDVYGQLIDTTIGALGQVRTGGDGGGISKLLGPPPTERLVAFYQGVTKAGADGMVHASFKMPDFNGTVKVMAIAWSKTGVGHGSRDVLVRDPVVIQASLPNFLAPGDRSRLQLNLTHVQGPSGAFKLDVTAAGSLVEVDDKLAHKTIELADKGKAEVLIPISGKAVGDETITASLTGPDGTVLTKTLTLGVRNNEPPVVRVSDVSLKPGSGKITLNGDLLADMQPGTGYATVTVGTVAGIDLPGLVHELDKYPYGCTEQTTSRALPLVYLDDVILAAGLSSEEPVRDRVQGAIERVLVNQGSDGSFGLWSPGESQDLWLDAFVTDFLTRAKEKSYDVPPVAFDLAVTNLKNRVAYASDFTNGGEDVAYGLYVLARNGRASIGDLRYYAETKLDSFGTPLARAQLGAALALYGDAQGASNVFRSALGLLADHPDKARSWRTDYGSDLRDSAAILALASESRLTSVDFEDLSRQVGQLYKDSSYTSTQEQAWMLLAANAMLKDGLKPVLDVSGEKHEGVFTASYGAGKLASSDVVVANAGSTAVNARITVQGVPVKPDPAGGNGYSLSRTFYDLEGNQIDPAAVPLGQRMVVVLDVTSTESAWAHLMIDDPLPAGFAIDNPSLVRSGDVSGLDWLSTLDSAAHVEYRTDRFTAAVDLSGNTSQFQFAYMARAIAPGSFNLPAATLVDMYRPEKQARTDAGKVEVVGALQ
ncbi:alpha-2-macroglobulin family protein [Oryzibacter oryziterrae]|uniref:alpha-2-macroglobulin family protein n=1 Tax=Oryzibacter oryziterrae TaxID=2766474 RepID=UPI001F3AC58A|nr:alpha-2-macroglobulin family protein [Oryzibacter oryziterrae]